MLAAARRVEMQAGAFVLFTAEPLNICSIYEHGFG
jgi:hypothetical protein